MGSIPGGVTWDFFRGSFRHNHVLWGRLSLWKWVPGISPGVKAAGAFGWRPTTLVVPKVEKIRGLNLPGTPRATSVCRGIPLLFTLFLESVRDTQMHFEARMSLLNAKAREVYGKHSAWKNLHFCYWSPRTFVTVFIKPFTGLWTRWIQLYRHSLFQ